MKSALKLRKLLCPLLKPDVTYYFVFYKTKIHTATATNQKHKPKTATDFIVVFVTILI